MKKLKYLLFLFLLCFSLNVFADTSYDMTSLITSPVNYSECGVGSYTGVELNGATNCWNTKTRYQGTLNRIYFNLPAPTGSSFENDTSYRLTLKMATNDWRNNFGSPVVSPGSNYTNNFVDTFNFVSKQQINITFTVPYSGSTTYQTLYVNIPAVNSSSLITGDRNWNLSNVTLTKLTSGSSGGSTNPSGPSTSWDDTGIINNSNENTQNIIDNNNTNTQDIINNNNQNTENIINNQNENNQSIINGIDSVNQQLGSCYRNLLKNIYYVNAGYNVYLGNDDIYYQYQPDTYSSPRSLKLQLRNNSDVVISQSDYMPSLSVGRFNFSFTYTDDISYLITGINGAITDTTVKIPLDTLDLDSNTIYTISYTVSNASNGSVQFRYFSLIKGNYTSNVFIDYDKSVCSSKLDDINGAIGAVSQNVIINNNQNTENIINNQNINTQQQIESQQVCEIIDKNYIQDDNSLLNIGGYIVDNSSFGITKYFKINQNTKIKVIYGQTFNAYLWFYDINKNKISGINNSSLIENNYLTIPSNASYVRFTIVKSLNKPQFSICQNGNQVLSNSITDVNDSITNSNVDTDVGSGFFDNFESEDFGLSQIITIPLNTIQSLTSKSCVPLNVPIPFTDSNITLPCMTEIYQSKLPTIYNLWKIVSFGIIAYLIAIDIFHIVKGFKDPESDKVEVLDL